MSELVKTEHSEVSCFMGSQFELGDIRTVGDLRKALEEIAAELPSDNSLEIAEVYMLRDELGYTLKEGVY
jgi:hypothetical protein